jgi:hypothetical protein
MDAFEIFVIYKVYYVNNKSNKQLMDWSVLVEYRQNYQLS